MDRPAPDQSSLARLQALAVLGSRLGKPPGAARSCASAASGAPDICLGAGLPPPLQDALVAERRDSASGVVVSVTAELSFPAGTGAAQARYAELGALLWQAYGAPRRVDPRFEEFTAGPYAVALELVKDLAGQSYVYLDLGAAPQRR